MVQNAQKSIHMYGIVVNACINACTLLTNDIDKCFLFESVTAWVKQTRTYILISLWGIMEVPWDMVCIWSPKRTWSTNIMKVQFTTGIKITNESNPWSSGNIWKLIWRTLFLISIFYMTLEYRKLKLNRTNRRQMAYYAIYIVRPTDINS